MNKEEIFEIMKEITGRCFESPQEVEVFFGVSYSEIYIEIHHIIVSNNDPELFEMAVRAHTALTYITLQKSTNRAEIELYLLSLLKNKKDGE